MTTLRGSGLESCCCRMECFFDLMGEEMRLDEKQRTIAMTLETGNV
jgi:hypothetical protein